MMCEFEIVFTKNGTHETEVFKGSWQNLNDRVKELHEEGAKKVFVNVVKN